MNARSFGYAPAVDGLRAVAVLSVLIFHFEEKLLPGGFVGVDVFFVISGFVVTGSLMGLRFERLRDLMTYFYSRRLLRIAPALIVMLLVTALFATLFIPDIWLSSSMNEVAIAAFFGFSNVMLGMQHDTYFAPAAAFHPYIHTWSLGVEEQFYFVFPLLMYWHQHCRRNGRDRLTLAVIAAASIASLALCAALTNSASGWRHAFYMMPPRFWELGTGMLLCLTMPAWRPALARLPVPIASSLAVASVGFITIAVLYPSIGVFPFPMALLPVLGTTGLIAVVYVRSKGILPSILSSSLAVAIGKRSYSLYLWHYPVYVAFRWTVGMESWLAATGATVLVFLIAEFSFRFVENPTRHNTSLLALPRGLVVAASLLIVNISAGTAVAMMKAKPNLSLSQTTNSNIWYADERKALMPDQIRCTLTQRIDRVIGGGSVIIWSPEHCPANDPPGRLFVIGDSHATHYVPMLRRFAAWHGIEVHIYSSSKCPFLALYQPNNAWPDCAAYFTATLKHIQGVLRSDDVIFLPCLRLRRFIEPWGPVEAFATDSREVAHKRQDALVEAHSVLGQLVKQGSHIVFEAPTPIFRSPPFRCVDWFNANNPICKPGFTMPTPELEKLREPIIAAIRSLQDSIPNIEMWDPFPVFCNERVCSAVTSDGPLFFDADHLSGIGNDRLYPSFEQFMSLRFDPSERLVEHRLGFDHTVGGE